MIEQDEKLLGLQSIQDELFQTRLENENLGIMQFSFSMGMLKLCSNKNASL